MRSKTAWVNSPHHILCPEFCVQPNAPSKVTNAACSHQQSVKTPENTSCKRHDSVTIVFAILQTQLNITFVSYLMYCCTMSTVM